MPRNNLYGTFSNDQDTPATTHSPRNRESSFSAPITEEQTPLDNDMIRNDIRDSPPQQPSFRHRSSTITSIVSDGYHIVKEHMDKEKFIYLILTSIMIYFSFIVVFAPRTSLSRDFRRFHSTKLTTAEIYRIYLDTFQSGRPHLIADHLETLNELNNRDDRESQILEFMVKQFKDLEFIPKIENYYPWVTEPILTSVSLLDGENTIFNAAMMEDCLLEKKGDNDPKNDQHQRYKGGFHAYSPNGLVTNQYIYSNYGTLEDYKLLLENNIDIEGKIHIIRQGQLLNGLKVKNAQLYGASGVILYRDPHDDGNITRGHGFEEYPDGPARNPSSIERDTVQYFFNSPGDPTTPGYPSKFPNMEHLSPTGKIPSIPSVPMSAREIQPILETLTNRGYRFLNDSNIQGFQGFSGPSPPNLQVRLYNEQTHTIKEISNVVITIPGILTGGDVIIGAHRDTWGVGGVSRSFSGTAILLEIARGMKELRKKGWIPLRTIKLISWDGKQPSMIGSTEFIEEHMALLKRNALVYLNLDHAVSGTQFTCSANPLLNDIIYKTAKMTSFKKEEDHTLYEEWTKASNNTIDIIGGDSDYMGFQHYLGIPSATFAFENNGINDPISHVGSAYDSIEWLQGSMDVDFKLHNTMVEFIGLLSLTIGENELASFKTHHYLNAIYSTYNILVESLSKIFPNDDQLLKSAKNVAEILDLITWKDSINFDKQNTLLRDDCSRDFPVWSLFKKFKIYIRLTRANNKLKQLDQLFITQRGLKDRSWFKHSILAPDKFIGFKGDVLPGLHEAMISKDRDEVLQWLTLLSSQFTNVRYLLQ
ncbi:putative zinc metalloprotease NDAI_0J02840 [Naumovozyma dairenensis CBS 421]|uniref:Vacuolar protein sorting-associated protein 70 n=1 Tax=Naumovozyma dairenensis (strain ATCC 10597 / BCRC 20456 / CBS 421 / NBRC 0211 / NRRL Y-12639) TaxID=1071378 RepID=G0WH98_NAUDC|nr:hypothetical protein NDAI_0J02840 [Naumovozyma dairenensis CBS 421]CCD27176.1 hypothetical protein NDAI_0J02840 [Naumovozyma dairenensis CBS 421]